jgi:hypothetical protein
MIGFNRFFPLQISSVAFVQAAAAAAAEAFCDRLPLAVARKHRSIIRYYLLFYARK